MRRAHGAARRSLESALPVSEVWGRRSTTVSSRPRTSHHGVDVSPLTIGRDLRWALRAVAGFLLDPEGETDEAETTRSSTRRARRAYAACCPATRGAE